MAIIFPTPAKLKRLPEKPGRYHVFRMFKRLSNGDFMIAGWVYRFNRYDG